MTLALISWVLTVCQSQLPEHLFDGARPPLGEGPLRWDWELGVVVNRPRFLGFVGDCLLWAGPCAVAELGDGMTPAATQVIRGSP